MHRRRSTDRRYAELLVRLGGSLAVIAGWGWLNWVAVQSDPGLPVLEVANFVIGVTVTATLFGGWAVDWYRNRPADETELCHHGLPTRGLSCPGPDLEN